MSKAKKDRVREHYYTNKDGKRVDFERLWKDPKYLRLHERKSAKFRLFQTAQLIQMRAPSPANAERLRLVDAALTRANKAIVAYEQKYG